MGRNQVYSRGRSKPDDLRQSGSFYGADVQGQIARDIFDTYETACDLLLRVTHCLERFHDYTEIFDNRVTHLLESRLVVYGETF